MPLLFVLVGDIPAEKKTVMKLLQLQQELIVLLEVVFYFSYFFPAHINIKHKAKNIVNH